MKNKKRAYSKAMAIMISCSFPLQIFAAGPGIVSEQEYDPETRERLQDDVIEYDEVRNLVHEFNSSIQFGWSEYEKSRNDLIDARDELKSQQEKGSDSRKEIMDGARANGDMETFKIYEYDEKGLQSAIESYQKTLKNFDKPKYTKELETAERTMTMHAQTAMMGYSTINANVGTLQKMKDLYDAKYEVTVQRAGLGMATQTEVLAAQVEALDAQEALSAMQDSRDSTRRSLIVMLGWSPDDQPEIRMIPSADLSQIELMNLEVDIPKAIGNNQTLISLRHASDGKSSREVDKKWRSVDEAEDKMAIEMERLYNDVIQKKLAFEAAQTGYEHAKITKTSVEAKHNLGMLGKADYIAAQLTYVKKEAAKEAADIALFQAIATYDWAVQGLTELEN